MRFPNLRYGDPDQFRYYAESIPLPDLAKRLRRDERTVRDWLSGRTKLPWWVPEILRLQRMEHLERMRQMGFAAQRPRLGVVRGQVIDFNPVPRKPESENPHTDIFPSVRKVL